MSFSLFPPKSLVVAVNFELWTDVATELSFCFPSFHNGRKILRNNHVTLRTEELCVFVVGGLSTLPCWLGTK